MENLVCKSPTEFEVLASRISESRTPEEFLDAFDDMTVYLTAQREIAAMLEMLSIHDAILLRGQDTSKVSNLPLHAT